MSTQISNTTYCDLQTIHHEPHAERSPIVFVHGFPDSPLLFADYITTEEQQQPWLKDRSIYTIAFPNRHTNAERFPSVPEMASGLLRTEFAQIMTHLIGTSPTGQVIPIVHDWGATYTWRFIRQQGDEGIERMVSLSVGSSFRYDIWEHGLRAFGWLYALLFALPYYIRLPVVQRSVANAIVRYAGYRSETAGMLYKDAYHYWDGPLWLLRLPFYLLGFAYQKPYTDFRFPVLFMRSPFDRIASTHRFEEAVKARSDSTFVLFEDANHWFPEQNSSDVLPYVRRFLAP